MNINEINKQWHATVQEMHARKVEVRHDSGIYWYGHQYDTDGYDKILLDGKKNMAVSNLYVLIQAFIAGATHSAQSLNVSNGAYPSTFTSGISGSNNTISTAGNGGTTPSMNFQLGTDTTTATTMSMGALADGSPKLSDSITEGTSGTSNANASVSATWNAGTLGSGTYNAGELGTFQSANSTCMFSRLAVADGTMNVLAIDAALPFTATVVITI